MRFLVTGAAGFIGFHLCRQLAAQSHEIVGIDSINDYYEPALKYARLSELGISRNAADSCMFCPSVTRARLSFQRLCLEDAATVAGLFAARRFDCVIHVAAQAGVRYSIENPRAYLESNVDAFLNVLEGCRAASVGHLVFASSSSVYGLSGRIPFSEHDAANHPVSLYAATKRSNELMAHAYSHVHGIPCTGLRLFTVYGPWGRPDMAYFKFARAIMEGTPIELFNSGEMKRDFTYIDDVLEAVLHVVNHRPSADPNWKPEQPDPATSSAPFRIYNVGSGRAEPLGNLVAALEKHIGKKAIQRPAPMQPGDVYMTEADVSDLARDFGWRPSTSLDEGIAGFVRWFISYRGTGAP
jgi:UDP-glucuronate 4-epimerase